MKNWGIALKLTLLILLSISIIFSLVFSYNYYFSRQIIIANAEENAGNLAHATVNKIDSVLQSVEKVPQNLAYFMENYTFQSDDVIDLLRTVVEKNPEIYGATIAFEPYAYSSNAYTFAPYFYKEEGNTQFTYIPYEYFYHDWYQLPKELDHPVWSEPYYDEGAGNIMMCTYSVPFYQNIDGKRKLMGIVTADISLSWLKKIVSSIKIEETGYGLLVTKNGTFVTHPNPQFIMNETVFSVAEKNKDTALRQIGKEMIRGKSGFIPFTSVFTGKECWLLYTPLASNGWALGILFPKAELMSDLFLLNRTVVILTIGGFFIILLVIILIAGNITRPLRALSIATQDMGTGNLDIELPTINSMDEVGRLTESFEYMKTSLKQYMEELTDATAARERIESELKIAHDIQMGILPKIFPPFPERKEFDIHATLEPAKHVGGDLYDFFFIDDDLFCFTLGDVSDKGVPAALFMAVTRTLIKAKATKGLTPEIVLTRVNQDLSQDNPSMMFVTLFMGILDTRTGEIIYANGGHNPPYTISTEGVVTPLEMTGGLALGVMEDFEFKSKKITLKKGDSIFIFTDGVTEAMNSEDELYSEDRLEATLAELKNKDVKDVIDDVMVEVHDFSKGIPQSDDITMMMIRFNGTS